MTAYRFGDWRVEPELNRVARNGDELLLEAKAMDVLAHLIEHNERVVATDELLEAVWPGRVVEQSTVHRRINQLRKVLGDDAKSPTYIQTIVKRGYRAIAPVERMETAAETPDAAALARVTPPFMAYEGDDAYAFACYSHQNRESVYAELERLRTEGVNIWYDEGIQPGSEWTADIARALGDCSQFIFFVTPDSVQSEHCRRELHFAQSRKKPITVIYLEPTELPDQLELQIGPTQAIHRHALDDETYGRKTRQALERLSSAGRSRRRVWPWAALALAVGVLVAAVVWWIQPGQQSASHPSTTIAVVPFEDLSPSGDQAWLGSGMAEALMLYLSRVEALVVKQVPRSATETDFTELASQLNVGSIVQGSVQRQGNELHVTARLVDARDGTQLWSAQYERTLDDVFDIQRDIARAIVEAVESELGVAVAPMEKLLIESARYGTDDVRAYELYLKAFDAKFRHQPPTEDDLLEALKHNLEAVEIDPNFALGHAGLGVTYQLLGDWTAGIAALDRALELEPGHVIAAANRAIVAAVDDDWAGAIAVVERVDPWTDVAHVDRAFPAYLLSLINLGRWQEAQDALEELSRQVERHPDRYPPIGEGRLTRGHPALRGIVFGMMALRRNDTEILERAHALLGRPPPWLAHTVQRTGRLEDARDLFVSGLPDPDRPLALEGYQQSGWLGMLRAVMDARESRGEACSPPSGPWGDIEAYAALGDTETLYSCLDVNVPFRLVEFLWTSPTLDPYRDDPRFRAALDRRDIVGYKNWPFTTAP